MRQDDPLTQYGPPLIGVIIAVVLSVLVSAMVAGQIDGTYERRAFVYAGFVLWVLLGAAVVFVLAHRGEAGRLSIARVLLWAASIWLWPVFLVLRRRRSNSG
jgi:hypothetical protein